MFNTHLPPILSICLYLSLYLFVGAWPYTESVSKGLDFEPTSMHRSNAEDKLVVGDANGAIKLYRFPCVSKDVSFLSCLPVCLSVCLSVYLSVCLSVYLSVYLSVCLSAYTKIYTTLHETLYQYNDFLIIL